MLEWTPEEASLLHDPGSTFSGSLLQRQSRLGVASLSK